MADVKIERKETLARKEAAAWLTALADALSNGGRIELPMGRSTVTVHVPDQVQTEIELEVDGDEVEIEVEIKWSRA